MQPTPFENDGHFKTLVTQGLAQVQLPPEFVHWPESRKFGLGAMLTTGLVILNVGVGTYQALAVDDCGRLLLAGQSIAVPFVGAIVVVVVDVGVVDVDLVGALFFVDRGDAVEDRVDVDE